uniref:Chromosome 2 open reading frame 69 n=1 Tax=Callorhinchus milii TaxID=7868 RepID=A0A4W3JBG8_CALMI
MARHAENARWQQWSLEDTAALLLRRFPSSHVWIVKASRMHLHKFSCYDNFVESDLFGAPKHSPDYGALGHLRALLSNASKQSRSLLCPGRTDRRVSTAPAQTILIGFSKGCVVLNQLLHELSEAQKDEELAAFIQTISQVYWLDGGHAGGSNTWVTSPEVLQELARTGIPVQTHVTPYQVRDSMRAWIGKEHEKFVRLLRELGANVTDQLHFENQPPSLKNHFQVLKMF